MLMAVSFLQLHEFTSLRRAILHCDPPSPFVKPTRQTQGRVALSYFLKQDPSRTEYSWNSFFWCYTSIWFNLLGEFSTTTWIHLPQTCHLALWPSLSLCQANKADTKASSFVLFSKAGPIKNWILMEQLLLVLHFYLIQSSLGYYSYKSLCWLIQKKVRQIFKTLMFWNKVKE